MGLDALNDQRRSGLQGGAGLSTQQRMIVAGVIGHRWPSG